MKNGLYKLHSDNWLSNQQLYDSADYHIFILFLEITTERSVNVGLHLHFWASEWKMSKCEFFWDILRSPTCPKTENKNRSHKQ